MPIPGKRSDEMSLLHIYTYIYRQTLTHTREGSGLFFSFRLFRKGRVPARRVRCTGAGALRRPVACLHVLRMAGVVLRAGLALSIFTFSHFRISGPFFCLLLLLLPSAGVACRGGARESDVGGSARGRARGRGRGRDGW